MVRLMMGCHASSLATHNDMEIHRDGFPPQNLPKQATTCHWQPQKTQTLAPASVAGLLTRYADMPVVQVNSMRPSFLRGYWNRLKGDHIDTHPQ